MQAQPAPEAQPAAAAGKGKGKGAGAAAEEAAGSRAKAAMVIASMPDECSLLVGKTAAKAAAGRARQEEQTAVVQQIAKDISNTEGQHSEGKRSSRRPGRAQAAEQDKMSQLLQQALNKGTLTKEQLLQLAGVASS